MIKIHLIERDEGRLSKAKLFKVITFHEMCIFMEIGFSENSSKSKFETKQMVSTMEIKTIIQTVTIISVYGIWIHGIYDMKKRTKCKKKSRVMTSKLNVKCR